MQPTRQLVSVRGISLYPEQNAIVTQFAAESGLGYSAAIRFIILDWVRLKRAALYAARVTDPGDGHSEEAHETDPS